MKENPIVFGSPNIEQEEIDEVVACLKSGWLSTGPRVQKFEEEFGKYVGVKNAVALNSCTAGLYLGLLAAGVGPGDEVITTPLTFAATANVIVHVGARPVFVDVREGDMTIDPARIEAAITHKTKAIIPVHFAGRPCRMAAIFELADKYGLYVISDAAHAVEAKYRGAHVGALRHLAAFSFYVTKNLATGEGGMVTTDNAAWAEKIRTLSLHGLSKGAWQRYSEAGYRDYEVVAPGYKYNMMDIQAAIGIHQLRKIEVSLRRRERIWARYDEAFADLPCITPVPPQPDVRHGRHLYTLLIDKDNAGITRDAFQAELHKRGIGTGIHFRALHLHAYYRNTFSYVRGQFPAAEFISDRTVSLPLSAKLTDAQVGRVVAAVKGTLQHVARVSGAGSVIGAA